MWTTGLHRPGAQTNADIPLYPCASFAPWSHPEEEETPQRRVLGVLISHMGPHTYIYVSATLRKLISCLTGFRLFARPPRMRDEDFAWWVQTLCWTFYAQHRSLVLILIQNGDRRHYKTSNNLILVTLWSQTTESKCTPKEKWALGANQNAAFNTLKIVAPRTLPFRQGISFAICLLVSEVQRVSLFLKRMESSGNVRNDAWPKNSLKVLF